MRCCRWSATWPNVAAMAMEAINNYLHVVSGFTKTTRVEKSAADE